QALELFAQLAADFPDSPEHQLDCATAHYGLGTFLLGRGGPPAEIEDHFRKGWAIQKKLAETFPTERAYSLEWVKGCNNLGLLLRARGGAAEAEGLSRRALPLREKPVLAQSADVTASQERGHLHNNLAILLKRTGRFAEADSAYRQALAVRRQL